jgi:hypothetical protein
VTNFYTYIFVCVQACNYFTCTSSERSRKSFIAQFVEENLGDISISPTKNGELKACSNCHIDKTTQFIMEQKETPDICAICKKELTDQEQNKPKWQWEMESGALLCKSCYQKKDADYNKKMNFCAICNCKLGLFFYHPKPAWQIEGNLCRKCWDQRNNNGANIKDETF